jgi:hypothetical protein
MEAALNGSGSGVEWHYELNGGRLGPVSEADILSLITNNKLVRGSFVWKKGMPDWVALESTQFASQFADSPPPLIGDAISNTLIWWLAFAPLLGAFIAGLLAGATHKSISNFWWTTLALNVALSMLDERNLKKAGHDTEKMGGAWVVPVYMFKRAKVLKQNNAYFIVWVVLFCLSLFSDI